MRIKAYRIAPVCTLATALVATGPASAAILGITNAQLTTPVSNQVGMTGFDAGGTTYNVLSVGTVIDGIDTGGDADYWNGGTASTTGVPASATAALEDDLITTGNFGGGYDGLLEIDTITVNDGDAALFYITEHSAIGAGPGNDDGIVVRPLDAGGAVIGGWTLTLDGTDWAKITDITWNANAQSIVGVSFAISDFTGGAGTLTGVSGLQIDLEATNDSNTFLDLDPGQVGVALIPEPASLVLLGLGGLMMIGRGKRA